jgi:heme-degrading monooxygenase HmoA
MYTIIWRFTVKPDAIPVFENHYGADGSWVHLFRAAPGYVGSELLRDVNKPNIFITFDHWRSAEDFVAFNPQANTAYEALDRQCDALTLYEEKLGTMGS